MLSDHFIMQISSGNQSLWYLSIAHCPLLLHIDCYTQGVEQVFPSYVAIVVVRFRVIVPTIDLTPNSFCFRSYLDEAFWLVRVIIALW